MLKKRKREKTTKTNDIDEKEDIEMNINNNLIDNEKLETNKIDIIEKQENFLQGKKNHLLSFEIILKINFNNKYIITVKELSNERIGVLFEKSMSIFSSKTFIIINEIKFNVSKEDSDYRMKQPIDFFELKNNDLIILTSKFIHFYKLSNNQYILNQTINESIQEKKQEEEFDFSNGKINSIFQSSNEKIISCNDLGFTIYCKKKDQYILDVRHKTNFEVINVLEIKPNQIILFQKKYETFRAPVRGGSDYNIYSLSLYDIEKDKLSSVNEFYADSNPFKDEISFFRNNDLLFVKYGGSKFDIFDINQNMKSLNENNEIIQTNEVNSCCYYYHKVKDEMNIEFICYYSKNLFFGRDIEEDKIKLYQFLDKSFEYYQDFPFSKEEVVDIIKLRNDNLIMYLFNEIIVLGKK